MFAVHFDSEDSYIYRGETLYFKNEDSIIPFLTKALTANPKLEQRIIYEGGYSSEEEMLQDMLYDNNWWFVYREIATID